MNLVLNLSLTTLLVLHSFSGAQTTPAPNQAREQWHVRLDSKVQRQTVPFLSHGVSLSGTLYYLSERRPAAALVVLHGASSPSQTLPLYEHLEQMLPPLGIAVFVFDRRNGKGQSDFKTLAEDGVTARNAIAANPHVDPAKIGYWGISQGGWLALIAAGLDPNTAFVISVSAPMTTPDTQMNFAVANILRIHGYGEKEIQTALRARTAVDDYLRGTVDRASAQQALDIARARPWFPLVYMSNTVGDPKTSTWLRQMQFDPTSVLKKLSVPVLMLYGQDDPWVPVKLSMDRLQPIIRQRPSIDAIVVPGADHTMMLGVDPKNQVDPSFFPEEAPNTPAYFASLSAWLTRRGFAQSH